MPELSFIYLSYRPNGLDLLVRSLKDQTCDYELIVVDDCSKRWPGRKAAAYLQNEGVNLSYYGQSKPKAIRRAQLGVFNAMNTGVLYANSPFLVFLHDFMYLPPNAGELWLESFRRTKQRTLLQGIGRVCSAKKPDCTDAIRTWNHDVMFRFRRDWIPTSEEFELFYFGCPTAFADAINGFDERANHCGLFTLSSVREQAKLNDYTLEVNHALHCMIIEHQLWDDDEQKKNNLPFAETDWRTLGHLSSIPEEPKWEKRSPNPYNIIQLKEEIRNDGALRERNGSEHHALQRAEYVSAPPRA